LQRTPPGAPADRTGFGAPLLTDRPGKEKETAPEGAVSLIHWASANFFSASASASRAAIPSTSTRVAASFSTPCRVRVLHCVGSIQLFSLHASIIVETHAFSGLAKNGSSSSDLRVGTWPPTVA